MKKLAVLTCARLPDLNPGDQPLIPMFAAYGINAVPAVWDDPLMEWEDFDALLFRNTWDYYLQGDAFFAWLDKLSQMGIPSLNKLALVKWNAHKFYLKELEAAGVPILPTVFVPKGLDLRTSEWTKKGWKKVVIKPAVSAGSYLTKVYVEKNFDDLIDDYSPIVFNKDLLIQAFVEDIHEAGELSMIFFNGTFSHAVRKVPKNGDFRVQVQYGGEYSLVSPDDSALKVAEKALAIIEKGWLYARVDGVMLNGAFHIMEIEMIEPDLYFQYAEGAKENFVRTCVQMLNHV